MELCAALILAFLALDSKSFFRVVLAEESSDQDGELHWLSAVYMPFSRIIFHQYVGHYCTLIIIKYNCINLELNLLDDNALCWSVVWKIFPTVDPLDPDKQVGGRRLYLCVHILSKFDLVNMLLE